MSQRAALQGTDATPRTRLVVRVQPRSRRPGVTRTGDGGWTVRVAEPAERGRATEAALSALANALGVRRSAVRLVSGGRSRNKLVEVSAAGVSAAGEPPVQ